MDQALAAIHQANTRRLPIRLEVRPHAGQITLACDFPEELQSVIESQLYAQYPDCELLPMPEEREPQDAERQTWECSLHLHHGIFPIRRYPQFEDAQNRVLADPLTALFLSLEERQGSPRLVGEIELMVQPAPRLVRRRGERCLRRLASPFFRRHHRLAHLYALLAMSENVGVRIAAALLGKLDHSDDGHAASLTTSPSRIHDREEDLQAAADKMGRLLFRTHVQIRVTGNVADKKLARRKLRDICGAFGQFSVPRLASFRRAWLHSSPFLLSTEELATLWHLPTSAVRAPTMTTVESRELPPPVNLPVRGEHADLSLLGVTSFRGHKQQFGILPEDRARHMAIFGKTGMGKSTLLQNLITSDIHAGRGVVLLDPHGDLCEAVLATIPSHRTNDVILFDLADRSHPLSFNILHCPLPEQRPLVASGIVASFKKLYTEFWGPRLEHILRNAILALLEVPGATLLTVLRLLSDARFRQSLVAKLQDPVVRTFWQQEFASLPLKFQLEAIAPIQNKIGHFVSSPLLRNILGQPRTSLDLRRAMDDRRILLVNLSKGRLGEDASSLLGSFLVTALQLAAMSRADTEIAARQPCAAYIDEFQSFVTESFATILSEARKYRLSLTLANQYIAQMDDTTADAIFGNVGTMISFQVGAQDAETLGREFGEELPPRDLLSLPKHRAYIRALIDGHPSRPFSMVTLPPGRPLDPRRPGIIRNFSRQRYARPASVVEREILRALTDA
jgi:DNA helicase HerA-like ATPase